MKKLLFISFLSVVAITLKAQGTLQFNQVKLLTNVQQTVPSGKVWKITSLYGEEINVCYPQHCFSTTLYYGKGIINAIIVNGVTIASTIRGFKSSSNLYSDANCNNNLGGYDLSCTNKTSDPNILPMWLPAGTTIQTGGPNTFASVIEFNIIP